MVTSSYFLFLRIFHLPFSFSCTSLYLEWSLNAYHAIHGRIGKREVFRPRRRITVNKLTLNALYKVDLRWPKNVLRETWCISLQWFWFWFITVIAFNRVGLLRKNYFKISSNAPSNLLCNVLNLIFYSLRQFSDVYLTIGSCFSVHYGVMEHAGSLESTKEA